MHLLCGKSKTLCTVSKMHVCANLHWSIDLPPPPPVPALATQYIGTSILYKYHLSHPLPPTKYIKAAGDGKRIVVTSTSLGFIPSTVNWLAFMSKLNLDANVMILATDSESSDFFLDHGKLVPFFNLRCLLRARTLASVDRSNLPSNFPALATL